MELKLYELVLSKASTSRDIQNLIKSFYDPIEDTQRKLKKELLTFFDDEPSLRSEQYISDLFRYLRIEQDIRRKLSSDTSLGVLVDGLYYHNDGYVEEIGREKASMIYWRYDDSDSD
jgi:hypothetical protein